MIKINKEKYFEIEKRILLSKFGIENPLFQDINISDVLIKEPIFVNSINIDNYINKNIWINLPVGILYSLVKVVDMYIYNNFNLPITDFKDYYLRCLFKCDDILNRVDIYKETFYKNIILESMQKDRVLINNEEHLKIREEFLGIYKDIINSDIYTKES